MPRLTSLLLASVCSLILALGLSSQPFAATGAGEVRVSVPRGWESVGLADTGGGHVAIALRNVAGGGYALSIHRGARFEFIDLPTAPSGVTLSPDGGDVLVRLEGGGGPCSGGSLLASTEGRVRWQATDGRRAGFSSGGSVLLLDDAEGHCGSGSQLEIVDLDGHSLRLYDPGVSVRAALAVGRGERLLIAAGGSVALVDLADGARRRWTVSTGAVVAALHAVGADLFDAALEDGRRLLLDGGGRVRYTWDPGELARRRGGRATRYAGFRAYPGESRGTVSWFDGSPRGFSLDLASGSLSKRRFDASSPRGFTAAKGIHDGKLMFDGGATLLLRPAIQGPD